MGESLKVEQSEHNTGDNKGMENLFKQLNAAIKIQRVYAANHPMCIDAAADLYKSLAEYFKDHPPLVLNVSKNTLIAGDREFSEKDAGFFVALANYLHERQITTVTVQPQVRQFDVEGFLQVVCSDPEELRKAGGVENMLVEKRVLNIEAQRLIVETSENLPDDIDLKSLEGLQDQELFLLIQEKDLTENDHNKIVIKLKQGPSDVAKLLVKLSDIASTTEGAADLDSRAGYLADLIEKFAEVVRETEGEDQRAVFESLVGGITNLREDLQSPLIEALQQKLGNLDFGPEFMSVLNEALKNADVPMGSYVQDVEIPEIPDIHLSPEEVYLEFAHFYDDLPVNIEQTFDEEKKQLEETDVEEQAIDTLLEMLRNSNDPQRLEKTLGGIDLNLHDLINEERFDLAVRIIQELKTKAAIAESSNPELIPTLEESIHKAARADNMRKLLLVALNEADQEQKRLTRISLDLLGESAIPAILELLTVDQDPDQRTKLCKVAAHLAKGDLSLFKEKLIDPNWEVVRSMVTVLGNINDPQIIELFKMTVAHNKREVREASIQGLAHYKTPESVRLIMTAMNDDEPDIQRQAIATLGAVKADEAIPKLIEIVEQKDFFYKNLDMKLAASEALGVIGSTKAKPALETILRKRSLFHRTQLNKLKDKAKRALDNIRELEDNGEAGNWNNG